MATEYTWSIANLEATNDEHKCVCISHWRVSATDGENTASSYGTCSHEGDPTDPNFIPFADLTEADVLSWVHTQVNKEETEAALQANLDAQANPPMVSGMPWAAE